jgi:hypothetical protein
VNMQHQRYNKAYQFETRWTSKSKLRPSAYWIALRDAAIESGTPPPRAVHWMTENEK